MPAATFATTFLLLYIAHLTADHPLQTDHQAAHKANRGWEGWNANIGHAACHFTTAGLLLGIGNLTLHLHIPGHPALIALLWIATSHGFIDRRWPVARWMRLARQTEWAQHGGAAHVDQAAHIALGLLPAALYLTAVS
jgi:hypothetical protein